MIAELNAATYPNVEITITSEVRGRVDIKHANLQVIQGDVLDPASVEKAVQDHDAVLCSLRAGRKGAVRSEGTRNTIHAMEDESWESFRLH